jgi:hypothetical protein
MMTHIFGTFHMSKPTTTRSWTFRFFLQFFWSCGQKGNYNTMILKYWPSCVTLTIRLNTVRICLNTFTGNYLQVQLSHLHCIGRSYKEIEK